MAKQLEGILVCARFEKHDLYNYTDPANGQVKPLRSIKALLAAGDGTVSRISISLPPELPEPSLDKDAVYAFPCFISVNRKKQVLNYTLSAGVPPFPAPNIG